MKYDPISRRHFLQGVGSALAIPLLPSLLPEYARAQATTIPPRFVSMTSYYGQLARFFYPTADPVTMALPNVYATDLASITGPVSQVIGSQFDSLRTKFSVIRGLSTMDTHGHNRHFPLTGGMGTVLGDDGLNLPPRFPYSIDNVMAESAKIYPTEPRIRNLRLSPNIYPFSSGFSWNKVNGVVQSYPHHWNAKSAYQTIFGSGVSAKSPASSLARTLNSVFEDFSKVVNGNAIGSGDKLRLQNYMDHISDTSTRLASYTALVCAQNPTIVDPSTADLLYTNFIDMIVASLACNVTRIVTVNVDHFMSDLAILKSTFHGYSHEMNNSLDQSHFPNQQFLNYSVWIGKRVLELMTKLDALAEPNGKTILDNSIVFWTNELGDGAKHTSGGIPILVGGSAGGKLRAGQYIDFRSRPFLYAPGDAYHYGRPYNEILITFLQAMGLSPADYQREGRQGFGIYGDRLSSEEKLQMANFISGPKDNPLPHFYKG
ncbi:MAG: DUF1552 domain-containing protein [Bdellovibrionales bacterium]|nr:DUF1552 domain-containing protein [Bdellovibrionales bacterium]